MKWLPWSSSSDTTTTTRKFHVKAYGFKLQGFDLRDADSATHRKSMVLVMKLKRPCNYGIFSFHRTHRKFSSQVLLTTANSVEWHHHFDSLCAFSVSDKDHSVRPLRLSLAVLYRDSRELRAKPAVLGKVSLDLAELASKMEVDVQTKLPISLQIAGVTMEATLSVRLSFMELRNDQDPTQLGQNRSTLVSGDRFSRRLNGLNPNSDTGNISPEDDSDESALFDSDDPSMESYSSTDSGSSPGYEQVRRDVSWKRRRLSSTPARTKVEPLIKNTNGVNLNSGTTRRDIGKQPCLQSDSASQRSNTGRWEVREVESRDGEAKLKASVMFASFDQCSAKAGGESACAALVAVVAHWLHFNRHILPTKSQLDNLITQGSSEWRKLCNNRDYSTSFPDNHFDLETVLKADLRPLSVVPDKSFVGFFSPENFEHLKGSAMSFDQIWDKISRHSEEPRVYIVSWNDHFFVLKVEAEAFYIIDSLGKRLFEGCNKAFILKFDHSAVMYGKRGKKDGASASASAGVGNRPERGIIISRGKECCREFIKRFLAAIPVRELEVEEKKGTVSNSALYQRLQIDFHFTSYTFSDLSSQ